MTTPDRLGSVDARIRGTSARWPCTLLGVGVISRNIVDATIELANVHDVDLMLIASRRQTDCDALGGGYVCNWNAERLAAYVGARDAKGRVLLCRDHGGPWQNTVEIATGMSEADAMASARRSYEEDIDAGFAVLHIDPSVGRDGSPAAGEDVLARLEVLYGHCVDYARARNRPIAIEVGTEDQDSMAHGLSEFTETLERVLAMCARHGWIPPVFAVAQTGTKVMETRNVGLLDSPYRIDGAVPTEVFIPRLVKTMAEKAILLKQHNTDYLSDEVLGWHPWLGIHAANVAPEFGVVESRALIRLLSGRGLKDLCERFLEIAFASRKWEKWMVENSAASDRERAVIAGHYVFSTPAFEEIKADAVVALGASFDLDAYLRDSVKAAIMRYMRPFRLVAPS